MVSRHPVIIVAAALVLSGATFAAPAAAGNDNIDSEPEPVMDANPDDLAINHVRQHADDLGVGPGDVSDVFVMSSYASSHTGVTHVNLNQRYQGLEVFGGHATVNIASDGGVLYVGNNLVADLATDVSAAAARLDPAEAAEAAAEALELDEPEDLQVMIRRPADAVTLLSGGGISDEPITAKQGWQPTGEGLRLAWQLVIDDSTSPSLWNATVDAATGELLNVDDWTDETTYADLQSTLARTSDQRSSATTNLAAGATAWQSANPVEDGSRYRAYPQESPNDGDRVLFENFADGTASPFGWHDVSGTPGPDYTITRGNNVRAYLDEDADDLPDFLGQPDGGPSLTFDHPVDLNEHPQNYRDATVTNLFFWCNTIHDLFYLYGFDEASGNFQANNYGRGPEAWANDEVRCLAQSGAGLNNANFSTPTVESSALPRMRMYLWPGNAFGFQNQVVVDDVGEFGARWARVTPAPTVDGLSGLTFVHGGTGCAADLYPEELPGTEWAALLDGDQTFPVECDNVQRIQVAETLGASAVVVAQGSDADPRLIGGLVSLPNADSPPANVTVQDGSISAYRPSIPAVSVGVGNGEIIKAAIADGPTTGMVRKHPDHPGIRDGDFEAGVILHEYGHGLSNRLVGGPTQNCIGNNDTNPHRQGEGWSDYVAIVALLDPEVDDPDGTRGMGPYVVFEDDRSDNGIRPRPYSRNMAIQPFTYDSVKTGGWLDNGTLAMPHGVGHGWAAVLWDLTWDLIDKHGFNANLYEPWNTGGNNLAYQLVIDGLKMQGCLPGFVDARDAILAADEALTGGDNQCTIWASFARRGIGFSADQGEISNRDDHEQAFDTHPDCWNGFVGQQVIDQPALNTVSAGRTVPMRFDRGENRGLDVLASNSPYSRQINCQTLATEIPGQTFITPGALPEAAESPGNAGLSVNAQGRYTFPWQTEENWDGTCREFVLTMDNGEQHRAYFEFVE
jgi:extracellular elastinolytic metalloproteinase